jgi:hypothetical protein
MRKAAQYFLAAFALIALVWLTACERLLSGIEKETVLAFSEPITDNLFAGLATNDYEVFSVDFDSNIEEQMPVATFAALKQDLDNKLGKYLSRSVDQVTQSDEFYVVDYQAKFEQSEMVKITVAFHASDQSMAGFSIDSEKVSWSTFR